MKTIANNGKEKEVKKAPVKTTTQAKKTASVKSSITDKSIAKPKNTVHNATAKHVAADKTVSAKSALKDNASTKVNATVIKEPRRKRIAKKITEMHSDIVLHEHTGGMLNGFSILVGLFFIAQGVWGLQSNLVFNVFTTNQTHAIIHIVLGIIAFFVGIRQNAFGFTVFLGLLLATVGIMRLIPVTSDIVINVLNVNEPVAALNMVIGMFALLIAFTDTRSYHTVSH